VTGGVGSDVGTAVSADIAQVDPDTRTRDQAWPTEADTAQIAG